MTDCCSASESFSVSRVAGEFLKAKCGAGIFRSLCICASVSCSTAPLSPLSYLEEHTHSSAWLPARPSELDCADLCVCAACVSEQNREPKQPIISLIGFVWFVDSTPQTGLQLLVCYRWRLIADHLQHFVSKVEMFLDKWFAISWLNSALHWLKADHYRSLHAGHHWSSVRRCVARKMKEWIYQWHIENS